MLAAPPPAAPPPAAPPPPLPAAQPVVAGARSEAHGVHRSLELPAARRWRGRTPSRRVRALAAPPSATLITSVRGHAPYWCAGPSFAAAAAFFAAAAALPLASPWAAGWRPAGAGAEPGWLMRRRRRAGGGLRRRRRGGGGARGGRTARAEMRHAPQPRRSRLWSHAHQEATADEEQKDDATDDDAGHHPSIAAAAQQRRGVGIRWPGGGPSGGSGRRRRRRQRRRGPARPVARVVCGREAKGVPGPVPRKIHPRTPASQLKPLQRSHRGRS